MQVKNGFYSLGLQEIGSSYHSQISTTTYSRDYIISCYVKGETNGTAECRLLDHNGVDFIPAVLVSTTTSATINYWVHLTTTTYKPSNTNFKIKLSRPSGDSWKKLFYETFALPGTRYDKRIGVYNNWLYVNLVYPGAGGLIAQRYDGKNWFAIPTTGMGVVEETQLLHM